MEHLWQDVLTLLPDHEAQDAALFTSWKIDALKCKWPLPEAPILHGMSANIHQTTIASLTQPPAIQT